MNGARFALDPTDMPALIRTVGGWPGADQYPPLELRRVDVAEDAFARLGGVLAELAPDAREVLVVQDDTSMRRAGADLKRGVVEGLAGAGLEVGVCELAGGADGSLHAEFERLDEVMERLRPGVPVIALGSGIVTDLAKHACFTHEERTGEHLALVFCPTALSVLAYSTRMAVIAKDGVKRTWPSRLSDALVFDLTALAGAPRHLTLAGFGDLAPMFTSFADWRLGEALGLARFFEPSRRILEDVRAHFSDVAALLHEGAQDGLAMLAKMNVLGGLSVTLADESAPLSGYEHVIGHMLDMGSEHFNRRLADHGAQVGVALIPHAIAFDALVRELDPDRVDLERCYPSAREMETVVRDTFAEIDPSGQMAEECWSDYATKLEAWRGARERFEAFLADWPRERERLSRLLTPPEEAVRVLAAAGAPLHFPELDPPVSDREGRWAFEHAHLMRKRFSAGDLYYLLGWLDQGFGDRVFARRDELVGAAGA
ncbi:MAG: iron-containing alcohol dehydrogenase [Solirubrobacteraceae bacterium]